MSDVFDKVIHEVLTDVYSNKIDLQRVENHGKKTIYSNEIEKGG